ncbi:MAG: lysyl oxidase family protein [Acidimicrobiales bacterium]
MKRAALILLVGFLVAAVQTAATEPAAALPPGEPHIPDLVTVTPYGFRLVQQRGTPTRRLFFSNTIGNVGAGPLELRPRHRPASGTTDAYQGIYTHSPRPNPRLILVSSSLVGTFVFHPEHDHWHMEDFARYELRAIEDDGSTGELLRVTEKVSFCMIDTDVVNPDLPHFRMGRAHSCGQGARQGLRVGMGDTYSSGLPDQFIDITGVPDGTYRVVSISDPANRLRELDDANNAASVDVEIIGKEVMVIPGSGTGYPWR